MLTSSTMVKALWVSKLLADGIKPVVVTKVGVDAHGHWVTIRGLLGQNTLFLLSKGSRTSSHQSASGADTFPLVVRALPEN